jgi:hypothetical protein
MGARLPTDDEQDVCHPTEQYGIDTIDQLAAMVWKDMS